MKLKVAGLHMDVGESLQGHCNQSLEAVKKFFPEIVEADVWFSKNQHQHKADIKVHASHIHLRATADGADYYEAVEHAVQKILRQLDKYKGKLKKHRSRRDEGEIPAMAEIEFVHHQLGEESLDGESDLDVVHKHIKAISPMSVDEAVMQMDLLHSNFYMFQNPKTAELNIVVREEDGTISWVEPSQTKVATAKAS